MSLTPWQLIICEMALAINIFGYQQQIIGHHRCELVLLSFSFSERKEIISLVQHSIIQLLTKRLN
jgi:hypothetical protein